MLIHKREEIVPILIVDQIFVAGTAKYQHSYKISHMQSKVGQKSAPKV